MNHRTWIVLAVVALMMGNMVRANGLVVANPALCNANLGEKSVLVQFDLSWSNSWRTAVNWDAAWVFVKFQAPGSNNWQHATLSATNGDHLAVAGSVVNAVADGKGVFVYRSDLAVGGVNFARMRVKWNYGQDGYTFALGAPVNISVHAIEMVYIPAGGFYLGSTGSEIAHFYAPDGTAQTTNAFLVSSETNAITIGTASGNLYYSTLGAGYGDGLGVISAVYPKGYNAFYSMKYEISQGQYADFLNKLTAAQDTTRYSGQFGLNRHTISGSTTNRSASAPDWGCNYMSWPDGCAYAAWAGLRPLTELEYEKMARGPAVPVANEYAWGTTVLTNMTAEAGVSGSGTETPSPATANCNISGGIVGPVRVGIFATATSSRQASGAGYYGVMDLSGGLADRFVTVGTTNGRAFTGSLGSGWLNASGDATNTDWYALDGSGAGFRGGRYDFAATEARLSLRSFGAYVDNRRFQMFGWRGGRQAP